MQYRTGSQGGFGSYSKNVLQLFVSHWEEGRRMREEGRRKRKKEEGVREEGRRMREEGRRE
ncbi:MAG: hypothetical protein HC894_30415, partial [Microcoleus sp. SM1_3_4]|nr:hypothetical protein [Microcoleus sp. SM1_3_4]